MKNPELRFFLCLIIQTTSLSNYWVTAQNELATETVRFIPDVCGIGLTTYMAHVLKSMYKDTYLQVIFDCPDSEELIRISKVEWRLLSTRCFNKLGNTFLDSKTTASEELDEVCNLLLADTPANTLSYAEYRQGFSFVSDTSKMLQCSKINRKIMFPFVESKWHDVHLSSVSSLSTTTSPSTRSRFTRSGNKEIPPNGAVVKVESDGVYVFILLVTLESSAESTYVYNVTATIVPHARHGHLSAIDYPLLPFYAAMCAVYALFLILWFIICCCYRREILQVHFWIIAVILLGLLEMMFVLGELETLNRTGYFSAYGVLILGELVYYARQTVIRILVMVISVGLHVIRPHYGNIKYKLIGLGGAYFIAGAVEGCVRVSNMKADNKQDTLYIPFVMLTIVDMTFMIWTFCSLTHTLKTLRLRRNLSKLSTHRHFLKALIFRIIVSTVFTVWSGIQHKMVVCLKDWKSLWFDEAFWRILSSTFLLIIMILWRPSENNKIYDCTNDQDEGYHDSENQGMNFAFDGMQLRSKDDKNETNKENVEANDEKDDLKLQLLERKMALSLTDSALPSMSDLVEEIVETENEEAKLL